ncbi:hypothetical protein OPQ81_006992 [Rhizoctonia solani]|nr:hypothetical protein OPQ81_006992 [Rhizoctonia solani]
MILLSDLSNLLTFTPNLEDLCLTIVQPETSSSACLISARCPSLKHLTLELMVEQPVHDPMGAKPPNGLISFRSLGCFDPGYAVLDYFVLQPSADSLRAIELHRAQSPDFLSKLAKDRGNTVESITLRSMEPSIVRTWEIIIGQFTALQHLSVWGIPSGALLQSICAVDLRHFEFRRPWTHAYKDTPQINDLIAFLKTCPALRALKYHSAKPIEVVDKLIIERGLTRIWNENYYIDGYMEDPKDLYAAPYSSWRTLAFPPPTPNMTKPRASGSNFDGFDTSGWDLPIHSAKSDLFL